MSPFGYSVRMSVFSIALAIFSLNSSYGQSAPTESGTPTVATNDATAVATTSVELHSTVNPSGRATTTWFEWGTSTPFSNKTDGKTAGSGTVAVAFSQGLSGLQPKTNYYFQAVAR